MTTRPFLLAILALAATGCSGGSPVLPGGPGPGLPADALEWGAIPSMMLTVGVPTQLDLRDYLTDPGDPAAITLDEGLPPGLDLVDGVIGGTPTAEAPGRDYVATADDGEAGTPIATSAPFSIEVAAAASAMAFERATPEQIGIYMPVGGSVPSDASGTVRYRPVTETDWRTGHPLLRIVPAWNSGGAPVAVVDALAGTIFDLTPGTSYDIEVTAASPTAGTQTFRTVFSTRALPPASAAPTVLANPSSNLQSVFDALVPGDVLELASGTYDVSGLHVDVSGTAGSPITIRGASRDGVVLRRASGIVLQFQHASHVIVENVTLEGSGVDSGTAASSVGVSFWNGALQEFVTLRDLSIRGVDQGIVASGTVNSILVYHCVLRGNNLWIAPFIETNLTWNDDGVRLPGEGNCAFENTLHAFGDSFAVDNGTFSAAVYFYRNRITMTGDDACEGDYGTRNLAFYDNHVTNSGTLLSLDPLWGGPLYCFRNVSLNTIRGPFKLNSEQSGFLVYNNTIVRTDGTTGWGWVQFNNGRLRNWSFRNNILIYRGLGGLLAVEPGGNDPIDFTHNAWFPDGSVWWTGTGGSFTSLAGARNGVPATTPVFGTSTRRHDGDLLLTAEPFTLPIPLGVSHLFEITSLFTPLLGGASAARNAGTEIPNVTDGYSGSAPDMGAIIAGRPTPSWGAPP